LGFAPLLAAIAATGLAFALWANLDMEVARLFYGVSGGFPANGALGHLARTIGRALPFVIAGAMALAFAARRLGLTRLPAPSGRGLAFVVLSLALGPGLLINLALKDHSHRPRPVHLREFGGGMEFRPFYRFDGACGRNCSFASGETSAAVWIVAPAMLAPPPWRAPAVGAALAFGVAVGALRMDFGHHFLSDVVFAVLLTLLVIVATYRGLRLDKAPRDLC